MNFREQLANEKRRTSQSMKNDGLGTFVLVFSVLSYYQYQTNRYWPWVNTPLPLARVQSHFIYSSRRCAMEAVAWYLPQHALVVLTVPGSMEFT